MAHFSIVECNTEQICPTLRRFQEVFPPSTTRTERREHEDVKDAISTPELAGFLESVGISTDDVWTGPKRLA